MRWGGPAWVSTDRLLPHPMHVRSSFPPERDYTVSVGTVEFSLPELAPFPSIFRTEMLNVHSHQSGSWSSSCIPQIRNPDSTLPCTHPHTHTHTHPIQVPPP